MPAGGTLLGVFVNSSDGKIQLRTNDRDEVSGAEFTCRVRSRKEALVIYAEHVALLFDHLSYRYGVPLFVESVAWIDQLNHVWSVSYTAPCAAQPRSGVRLARCYRLLRGGTMPDNPNPGSRSNRAPAAPGDAERRAAALQAMSQAQPAKTSGATFWEQHGGKVILAVVLLATLWLVSLGVGKFLRSSVAETDRAGQDLRRALRR